MKTPRSSKWLLVVPVLASLAGAGCSRGGGGVTADPQTEDEKTFYTLGLMLGRNTGSPSTPTPRGSSRPP